MGTNTKCHYLLSLCGTHVISSEPHGAMVSIHVSGFFPLLKLEFLSGVPISGAEESGLACPNQKTICWYSLAKHNEPYSYNLIITFLQNENLERPANTSSSKSLMVLWMTLQVSNLQFMCHDLSLSLCLINDEPWTVGGFVEWTHFRINSPVFLEDLTGIVFSSLNPPTLAHILHCGFFYRVASVQSEPGHHNLLLQPPLGRKRGLRQVRGK